MVKPFLNINADNFIVLIKSLEISWKVISMYLLF